MIVSGEAIAGAASTLIGSHFRLHGRDPETGLDCVGVIFRSLQLAGAQPVSPSGYSLRNTSVEPFSAYAAANRLLPANDRVASGDILMVKTGPAQFHLLVAIEEQVFVHADAGLRLVTKLRGPLHWEMQNHWRYRQSS